MDSLAPPARLRSQVQAMPLRSYRTKQWLSEAQIEGWFPPLAAENEATASMPNPSPPAATIPSRHRPDNASSRMT